MRHAPSSLFAGSPLRPGCATSSPRLHTGPPPHALHPFAQTAGAQHGQCANPLLSIHGQSPPPWLHHPQPPVYASHPTHMPSTPLRGRQGCSTDSAPTPSFPFADSPLRPGCATLTPGLRAPPRPHTLHPFARATGAQHRQCATPLLSVRRQSPPPGLLHPPPPVYAPRLARTPATPLRTCRRRRVDSAPPPLFGQRGLPPPSVREQSPLPALPFARMPGSQEAQHAHLSAHGSPLCSGYAIPAQPARPPPLCTHAEGWCAPARSSLAQPALVPAPPCSRLT